jgi:hypothetical protein
MPKIKQKEMEEEIDDDVIIVTESVKIDAGRHSGIITNVVRNMPNEKEGRSFDYLDLTVKITDVKKEPEIKVGFPTNISELSQLGRLLKKAKMDFSDGDKISISDIKSMLIDKKITFLCNNETTENGVFVRILRETIEFVN